MGVEFSDFSNESSCASDDFGSCTQPYSARLGRALAQLPRSHASISDFDSYELPPLEKKKKKSKHMLKRNMSRLALSDAVDVEQVVNVLNGEFYGQVCAVVSDIPDSCIEMSPSAWKSHYHKMAVDIEHRGLNLLTREFQPIVYNDNIHSEVYIVLANKNDQIKEILDDFFGDCHFHIMPYISYFIHYYFGKKCKLKKKHRVKKKIKCRTGSGPSFENFDEDIQMPKKKYKVKKKKKKRKCRTGWGPSFDNEDIQISSIFENTISPSNQNRGDKFKTEGSLLDVFGSLENTQSSSNQKRKENSESEDSLLDFWSIGFSLENTSNALPKTCSQNDDFSTFISKNTSSKLDIMSQTRVNPSISGLDLTLSAYDLSKEENNDVRADPFANLFDPFDFENTI